MIFLKTFMISPPLNLLVRFSSFVKWNYLLCSRSTILPGRAFYIIGNSNGIFYYTKKAGCLKTANLLGSFFLILSPLTYNKYRNPRIYINRNPDDICQSLYSNHTFYYSYWPFHKSAHVLRNFMAVKEPTYKIWAFNSINNGSLRRRSAVDPAVRMALAPMGGPR